MSEYVAALATIVAVYVMLRAERKDMAKTGDLAQLESRLGARIDGVERRIDALDAKLSARIDTVVLELGKAFGRPSN
jgi:hypothetical protein